MRQDNNVAVLVAVILIETLSEYAGVPFDIQLGRMLYSWFSSQEKSFRWSRIFCLLVHVKSVLNQHCWLKTSSTKWSTSTNYHRTLLILSRKSRFAIFFQSGAIHTKALIVILPKNRSGTADIWLIMNVIDPWFDLNQNLISEVQ